jgi:hypothetical protein
MLLMGLCSIAQASAGGERAMTAATATLGGVPDRLFTALLQYRSASPSDAVIPSAGREGSYIGSGDGSVTGERLQGVIRWSLFSENCVYPAARAGQAVPAGLHLCTMNPGGFIETSDGARIRFEGRGYGLRTAERYRTGLTLVFTTEDTRYAWLTPLLGLVDGEFDESAGRATWNVYVPAEAAARRPPPK